MRQLFTLAGHCARGIATGFCGSQGFAQFHLHFAQIIFGGGAATLMDMGGVAEVDPRAVVLAILAALLVTVVAQLWRTPRR